MLEPSSSSDSVAHSISSTNKRNVSAQLVLNVENLHISSFDKILVEDLSYGLHKGDTLAIVGESGSGKSISSLALLGLLPKSLQISGKAELTDIGELPITQSFKTSLNKPTKRDQQLLQRVRGAHIGMVFQEPMTALNPLHTVGKQLAESLRLGNLHTAHSDIKKLNKDAVHQRTIELLEDVNIKAPASKLTRYPHELSGGQRQRVMIAMALAQNPSILIADEPTTALDVTLQHDILNLLNELKVKHGMAMVLISHDLNLVRRYSDDIIVMRAGQVVEQGKSEAIFAQPKHDYTRNLIKQDFGEPLTLSEIQLGTQTTNVKKTKIIDVNNLTVRFPQQKSFLGRVSQWMTAVDNISLSLEAGQAIGVVGESGSGKTTLALALTRLLTNQAEVDGTIYIDFQSINSLNKNDLRKFRSTIQMVFQDPFASINPRFTVMQIIEEGLLVQGVDKAVRQKAVIDALQTVQLPVGFVHRYAHELSGGQRQRVALARALVMRPKIIILDEPTSALDSSTQVAVTQLLRDIQQQYGISYVFISHDLNVVRALCQQIMVMQAGKCVEYADSSQLFSIPQHPYTKMLINSMH